MNAASASASATTLNAPKPAGAAWNDILILCVMLRGVESPSDESPRFSFIVGPQSGILLPDDLTVRLLYRRLTQADAEPAVTGWTLTKANANPWTAVTLAYRHCILPTPALSDPRDGSNNNNNGGSVTSLSVPGITTTFDDDILIGLGATNRDVDVDPPGTMTERIQVASPADAGTIRRLCVADELRPNDGATGARVWSTAGAAGKWVGAHVAIKPRIYSRDSWGIKL